MKNKHTPGQWIVSSKEEFIHTNDRYHQIIANGGPKLHEPGFTITGCININDARLIAAAPELLEALESILSDANSPDYEGGFSEASRIKAEAAINKAKGI